MPDTETPFGPREQLAIWLLLISAFVVILNETVMGVALPRLMEDLRISAAAGQWLTTVFLLTMSVVIPITGMLIQRVRTRPLFITAMSLFTTGTLVSALAPGFGVLLVGRVVQAGGTAIMMPL
ncbi:MAG: MFS transporter, partial [Leucobacter sp.]|nr:MFS transporter [Leucobacter sp.]